MHTGLGGIFFRFRFCSFCKMIVGSANSYPPSEATVLYPYPMLMPECLISELLRSQEVV
jgi:hypothetical protein